jgi:hypothetical protein
MEMTPVSVSGIGDAVFERYLYRARYRLVPRRPGALTVPPFSASLGEDRGESYPVRLNVRKPPEAGRTAEFLGGVGRFEVEATAEPDSVRPGQTIEYRVTITGPAARGVTEPPDISRLERLPSDFQVERRPDVASFDPPYHTFVYRLRPTRAGAATLPPVRVAAFDPDSSRYQTKATAGVPVRVTEVPRFDASTVAYPTPPAPRPAPNLGVVAAGSAAALVLSAAVVAGVRARRRGRAGRAARRACRSAVARLDRAATDVERGRIVTEGLIAYLGLTTDRPPGALTPGDAHDGIALATGSEELARRTERLVALCDAARFGPGLATAVDLASEGRQFFTDLAGAPTAASAETR